MFPVHVIMRKASKGPFWMPLPQQIKQGPRQGARGDIHPSLTESPVIKQQRQSIPHALYKSLTQQHCNRMVAALTTKFFYSRRGRENCYATMDNQDTELNSGHHSFCLDFCKIFPNTLPALCRFPFYSLQDRGIFPNVSLIT